MTLQSDGPKSYDVEGVPPYSIIMAVKMNARIVSNVVANMTENMAIMTLQDGGSSTILYASVNLT